MDSDFNGDLEDNDVDSLSKSEYQSNSEGDIVEPDTPVKNRCQGKAKNQRLQLRTFEEYRGSYTKCR